MASSFGPGDPIVAVDQGSRLGMCLPQLTVGRTYVCREVAETADADEVCEFHGQKCGPVGVTVTENAPHVHLFFTPFGMQQVEMMYCVASFARPEGPPSWASEVLESVPVDARARESEDA